MIKLLNELIRFLTLHIVPANFLHRWNKNNFSEISPKIIVSLTTIPDRIERLAPMLNSLIDQTLRPHCIYLVIPSYSIKEKKEYIIPKYLKNHPVVKIIKTSKDWGPATKLLPVIQKEQGNPNSIIIALDDDNIYPKEFISTYFKYSQCYPEAALTLRGWRLADSLRCKDKSPIKGTQLKDVYPTDIVNGCAGILVKPKFFDEQVFDYESVPAQAFFVDDIWFSGHLAKNGIQKFIIPFTGWFVYMPTLSTLSSLSLDQTENREGKNDDVMIEYFKSYWGTEL